MPSQAQDGTYQPSQGESVIAGLFTLANTFATPFAKKLAGETGDDRALLQERVRWDALNGSGPVDPTGAQAAPQTLTSFLFGSPGKTTSASTAGFNPKNLIMLLVVGFLAYWVFKKL